MTITVSAARRELLILANRGRTYRNDEVFYPHMIAEGTEANFAGSGIDLQRSVQIPGPNETTIEANARLRLLAQPDGNLFIRVRLDWTSPFGEHSSYAGYTLSEASAAKLDTMSPASNEPDTNVQPEDVHAPSDEDISDALSTLFDHMDEQESLGGNWHQDYPDFTDEIIVYHGDAVLAARNVEPKMLNMLSDSDMGAMAPDEITDLLDWLQQQPEMATHA